MSIWHYLSHGIIFTAEHLPSKLNVQADWESRNARDLLDWKPHQSMFFSKIKHFGYATVDLFASRLCYQSPQYEAWKPDPNSLQQMQCNSVGTKCFHTLYPPFSLISRILKKVRQEKVEQIIIVKLTWQTQPWYPVLLEISMQCPLLMTPLPDLLLDRQETKHPLVQNGKLMLVACLP